MAETSSKVPLSISDSTSITLAVVSGISRSNLSQLAGAFQRATGRSERTGDRQWPYRLTARQLLRRSRHFTRSSCRARRLGRQRCGASGSTTRGCWTRRGSRAGCGCWRLTRPRPGNRPSHPNQGCRMVGSRLGHAAALGKFAGFGVIGFSRRKRLVAFVPSTCD
jgi:hypothetical protein